jgi:hypothetical protein
MKTREEEVLEVLTRICEVNESVHFDISIPASINEGNGEICFEKVSYPLVELNLTLHEIERLERLEKISVLYRYLFKQLRQHEMSRTRYSLFVPTKTKVVSELLNDTKWKPLSIISLIGGILICAMAILMVANNANIVGYDTYYGGGYGYQTLTPMGALLIGIFVLWVGISTMPKRKK